MTVVALLVGALIGTGLRITLDTVIPHTDATFPWSTLLINVVGSFALAFLIARVWPTAPAWLRIGLGTGLLGTFTTFSALIVSLLTLTQAGMPLLALVYLLVSLGAGLAAALGGLRLGGSRPDGPGGSARGGPRVPPLQVDE